MQNGYAWLNPPPYISSLDEFVVFNTSTGRVAQGCINEQRAIRDCASLNEHEQRNGRPPCYEVRPNTRPKIFA